MILVYQAYGREDVIRQTLFSITSLLSVVAKESPLRILVYTDHLDLFKKFFAGSDRVIFRDVSKAEIQSWRGAIDFVHRVKVEVLIDAAKRDTGSLFYVDGDTFFRRDPTSEFQQVTDQLSLMHIAENRLSEGRDPLSRKMTKFVKRNSFQVRGQPFRISPDDHMWNAGAIGISQNNKSLLPDVLSLTDQMYSLYPKHVMEQLAFTAVLDANSTLRSLEETIGHYWNQKEEYQILIDAFLAANSSISQALSAYPTFVHPAPPPPKVRQSFWGKLTPKLQKFFSS